MVFDHIPEISAWMAAAGVAELELTGPDARLFLRLNEGAGDPDIETADMDGGFDAFGIVAAPTTGIFLHQHPARAAPLITDGAAISAGELVGLVRVGALLVPVIASEAGIVTAILVPSGQTVGYGTKLFEFERLEM